MTASFRGGQGTHVIREVFLFTPGRLSKPRGAWPDSCLAMHAPRPEPGPGARPVLTGPFSGGSRAGWSSVRLVPLKGLVRQIAFVAVGAGKPGRARGASDFAPCNRSGGHVSKPGRGGMLSGQVSPHSLRKDIRLGCLRSLSPASQRRDAQTGGQRSRDHRQGPWTGGFRREEKAKRVTFPEGPPPRGPPAAVEGFSLVPWTVSWHMALASVMLDARQSSRKSRCSYAGC